MVKTKSQMVSLGSTAIYFKLLEAAKDNTVVFNEQKLGQPVLVFFMCNHCPYVQHIIVNLIKIVKDLQDQGILVYAINSNDSEKYPEDAPSKMSLLTKELSFTFPYLVDASQEVARLYKATCTPDFFLYDKNHRLFYRGQLDGSRPGNGVPVDGIDLKNASKRLIESKSSPGKQLPSLGCNIKWKESS